MHLLDVCGSRPVSYGFFSICGGVVNATHRVAVEGAGGFVGTSGASGDGFRARLGGCGQALRDRFGSGTRRAEIPAWAGRRQGDGAGVCHSGCGGVFGRRVVEGEELEDVAQTILAAHGAEPGVDALLGEERVHVRDVGGLGVVEAEQDAAAHQIVLAPAAGEQAVVANLMEAGRQHVLQETAEEFGAGQAHALLRLGAVGVFAAVVAVAEGDAVVVNGDQAVVGDGDARHSAQVWSRDQTRAEQFARRMSCGCAFVNGMVKSDPRLPFGGIGDSGYGRELIE